MLVAFLTAFYMFRVVFLAFFGTPPAAASAHGAEAPTLAGHHEKAHGAHEHDPPMPMLLPLWILALLSLAVGFYSTFIGPGLVTAPEGAAEHAAPAWLTPAAVGVAVAGIALAWLTYQRRTIDAASLASMFSPIRRAALAKFWIDDLFERVLAAGTLAFSSLVGWVDRYIVDGVLNVVSVWTVTTGDEMRTIQTGRAQDYVYGLAVGLLLLLVWARWSLT
jgi:NADH-quinone oxidoreductase subunit L